MELLKVTCKLRQLKITCKLGQLRYPLFEKTSGPLSSLAFWSRHVVVGGVRLHVSTNIHAVNTRSTSNQGWGHFKSELELNWNWIKMGGIGIENFQETRIGIGIDFSVERNWPILWPFSIPPIHISPIMFCYIIHLYKIECSQLFSNTWLCVNPTFQYINHP